MGTLTSSVSSWKLVLLSGIYRTDRRNLCNFVVRCVKFSTIKWKWMSQCTKSKYYTLQGNAKTKTFLENLKIFDHPYLFKTNALQQVNYIFRLAPLALPKNFIKYILEEGPPPPPPKTQQQERTLIRASNHDAISFTQKRAVAIKFIQQI